MESSSRDRISVDLHGLKTALLERAQTLGVSPSAWVRATLAEALGRTAESSDVGFSPLSRCQDASRVRLSLRMSREQAAAVLEAARQARLSLGDYVADLVAGVPVTSGGASRTDHMAMLISSCAELSTFSRNLNHLSSAIRQSDCESAAPHLPLLKTLSVDVRRHLQLVAQALADLRPTKPAGQRID